jgi:PmbA protein
MKELIDIATQVTNTAMKYDDRVTAVKQSTASASYKELTIISSAGPVLQRRKTIFSAGAYLIASDGSEDRDGYDYVSSTKLAQLDYKSTGLNAAENACSLLGAQHISTDKYYIMFTCEVMADFIELLLDLVDGDSVYKGVSMLGDKLGQKVASSVFTLIDNPLVNCGVGSILFDDEGQACEAVEIIKDGQLKSFLHNSYTAKALGMENNARAVLSGGGNIGIGCSNVILASTGTLDNEYPEYLKITEVMGMHTADPVSGDFSVGISGVYYKDGKPEYPFKEAALSGNLADLLEGLIHVFDNRRTFGNITTADALFDKMTVSGV